MKIYNFKEGGFKMRADKTLKSIIILTLLTTLTGCFRMGSLFNGGSSGGDGGTNSGSSVALPTGGAGGPVPAVIATSQVMASLSAMTGVTPSATTKAAFAAQASNFNVTGDYTQVGAPLIASHATVAAEYCNDAVTQVPTKLFPGISFTGAPSQFSGATLNSVAGAMCRAFWRHDCSASELSIIQSSTASFITHVAAGSTAAVQTKTVAIALCTAMLTSLSAVSH